VVLSLATGALVVSGCGGGDESPVVRPPASPSTTAPSTSPTVSPSATGSPTAPVHPEVIVKPASGLRDGQSVTVTASGFSPGLSLIVVQCADKGQQTGPGDCNLAVSTTLQTDAAGKAEATLTVAYGPFGANGVVCSATQPCLVSVTEASFTPSQEADAPISFG
jgi:hypothetical protein